MKTFIRKTLVFLAIVIASSITLNFTARTPVSAEQYPCNTSFLGLQAWYCGVEQDPQDEAALTANTVKIVSNVLTDIGQIAAYLIVGFVIYGGYLYMTSSGDSAKAANSRKVLTRAFIGLGIVLLANVIMNAIRIALIGENVLSPIQDENAATNLLQNAINFAVAISGLICAIFIVIGGVNYMTSSGDSAKLQKAKSTLTYAIIGLIIVALSGVITNFVFDIIKKGEEGTPAGYTSQIIAVKELHE